MITILTLIGFMSCSSPQNTAYKNIDVVEFKSLMKNTNTIILDVRTPSETDQGIIEGAKIIDYNADGFGSNIDNLDKNKAYLVYCRSGGRSAKAAKLMHEKGFKNVCNLEGGYLAWSKQK